MNGKYADPAVDGGFTVVELLVTIFVAATFALGLLQLFTTFNYFSATAKQTATADSLAYTYIQKYARPDSDTSSWFTCDVSSPSTNDRTVTPAAAGDVIEEADLNADTAGLPGPVHYRVTAVAPYGCFNDNVDMPILVEAEIRFGVNGRVVRHAAYADGIG